MVVMDINKFGNIFASGAPSVLLCLSYSHKNFFSKNNFCIGNKNKFYIYGKTAVEKNIIETTDIHVNCEGHSGHMCSSQCTVGGD